MTGGRCIVESGLTYALFHYWWAWDSKEIRKAVLAGLVPRVIAVAADRFIQNRKAKPPNGRPLGWPDMHVLRSEGTFRMLLKGERDPPSPLVLGIAALLAVEPGELFPALRDWVAEAAVYLAAPRVVFAPADLKRVIGFDREEAALYAAVVLARPPLRSAVTGRSIDDFLNQHLPAVRTVAERIAGCLADAAPQVDD